MVRQPNLGTQLLEVTVEARPGEARQIADELALLVALVAPVRCRG